jgi:CRISPR-associated protein Cmr5
MAADAHPTLTLEQRRASDAWQRAQGQKSGYVNLAKGLPALIMNSGLLQVMAFLQEKGNSPSQAHCQELGKHLREWLHARFPTIPVNFPDFMKALMAADPATYREVTAEAFAWLRWVRQLAPTIVTKESR